RRRTIAAGRRHRRSRSRLASGAVRPGDAPRPVRVPAARNKRGNAVIQDSLSGSADAAIVVVGRDAGERETLYEELTKRYGTAYPTVACDEPAELEAGVRVLLAAGTPVALVIGVVGEADPDGIEVLARIRAIDPTTSRVAAVHWGEWDTARPIFDAITMGQIN